MLKATVLSSALLAVFVLQQGPTYDARQLDCSRFQESSQSRIVTLSAGRREQTSGRSAVWRFRASSGDSGIGVVGWLDSLSLWRRSPEATIRPDTDGLLGGRYRGWLSPTGAYASRAVPFIPDEVAEIAGMATALEDFFPPLPPRFLRPGEVYRRSGLSLRRLADSALSGVLLQRFELELSRQATQADTVSDTLPVELKESSRERGTFVWHPTLGLIRRERRIEIDATVPASPTVRQPIRTRVEQTVTLARDLSPAEMTKGCVS